MQHPYIGSLEARVQASNKEQVYESVRPNHTSFDV